MLDLGQWLAGLALCALALGPLGWGAVRVRARVLPGWSGAPAALAAALVALAGLILVTEALGAVGAFERWPVAIGCALAGLAAGAVAGRPASRALAQAPEPPAPPAAPGGNGALVAGIGAAAVAAHWAVGLAAAWREGMLSSDTLGYHMPLAARFAQDGRVFEPLFINADSTVTWLPHNNELLHAVGLVLMRSDVLSPLLPVGFLALGLLAAWTLGRPWGLGAPAMLGAAIVFSWPGLAQSQPGSANSDVVAYAPLLAAIALLACGGLARRPLLLAGLGAGLALGTKPTVMASAGALTLGVWGWLALDARAGRRPGSEAWRSAAAWAGMLALGAAPWFLRNLVVTGNPLPWFGLELGPLSIPDAGNAVGDSISRYLTDTEVWRSVFGPGLKRAMGTAWPLVVLAGLGGALASVVRPRSAALRVAGIVSLLAAAFYLVTPNGAAGPPGFPVFFENAVRYSMPALALGLALLPLWRPLERAARSWWWAAGSGLVLAVTIRAAGFQTLERVRLAVFCALAALVAALWLWRRRRGDGPVRAAPALAAVAALSAVALVAGGGWAVVERYQDGRYAAGEFAFTRAVHHARFATGGFYESYPFYGADLSNHVREIGRRGAHGRFGPLPDCRAWRAALARYDPGWVAVAPREQRLFGRGAPPAAAAWTATIPGATVVLARPDGARVYRLSRPPGAAGCA